MKTVSLILAVMICAGVARASFWNEDTEKEVKSLPKNIKTPAGQTGNPTPAQLESVGWIVKAVVPYTPPAGYEVIPGTRQIIVDGKTASEEWQIETAAQAEARREAEVAAALKAKREAEEENDLYKIMFKLVNLHRPENMKVTKEEAKAIVDSVIK